MSDTTMSETVGPTKSWSYQSPSCLPRVQLSRFARTKFWRVALSQIRRLNGRYVEFPVRRGFSVHRAERRDFEVFYGFNPRCSHQGTYHKPGYFRHFPDHYKERCKPVTT